MKEEFKQLVWVQVGILVGSLLLGGAAMYHWLF
jgi:hypothetical protein